MRIQLPTDKRQIGLWAGSLLLLLALVVTALWLLSSMLKTSSRNTPQAARVVTGKVPSPPLQMASDPPQSVFVPQDTLLVMATDPPAADSQALKTSGETVTVANSQPPAAPAKAGSTAISRSSQNEPATGHFSVQVGAFKEVVNARQVLKVMQKRGFQAFRYKRADADQQVWHLVCIGQYTTLGEASAAAKAFEGRYQTAAFVTAVASLEQLGSTD